MFTSILAATDRITGSDPVVVSAARLAAALDVPWSLIHVVEPSPETAGFAGEAPGPPAALDDIRHRITRIHGDLLAWTPPSHVCVVAGLPWEEIARQASRRGSDLIVMGPHAAHGPKDDDSREAQDSGNTMEGLVSRQQVPVLIVGRYPCRPKPAFEGLLVGIDFSLSCERALGFAADLARYFHSSVDLFHMLPVPPYPKYTRADYDADRSRAGGRLKTLGERWLTGLAWHHHVWGGALPYREILKCAAQCRSDTMVLGSHAREIRGKWYAGSTVANLGALATGPLFVLSGPPVSASSERPENAPATMENHAIRVFAKRPRVDAD